jgi:hypothetical protein
MKDGMVLTPIEIDFNFLQHGSAEEASWNRLIRRLSTKKRSSCTSSIGENWRSIPKSLWRIVGIYPGPTLPESLKYAGPSRKTRILLTGIP